MKPEAPPELEPHLRVRRDGRRVFGPGQVELLRNIADAGSIRGAAGAMHMSYARAWNLVRHMNGLFREPLVVIARGGKSGGGATLTATGRRVLELFDRMLRACRTATRRDWVVLRRLWR